MEVLHGARKDEHEKTWPLLHARFLPKKFHPPTHTSTEQGEGNLQVAWGGRRAPTYAVAVSVVQSRVYIVSGGCSYQKAGCSAPAKASSVFRQHLGSAMHKNPPTSRHYT